jgi:DNA-binding transcriptional MerR regulator
MIMKRTWKIGELGKLAGLTIRTLRYYDQIGLYSPSAHSDSGHRLYTESDIERLQHIQSLKELGLSLDEIKSVLAGDRVSLFDILTLQIARLKENLRVSEQLLRELEHVSSLMMRSAPLTVEDFTKLLGAMRISHEKYFAELRARRERELDRLGDYLEEHTEQLKGGHNHE